MLDNFVTNVGADRLAVPAERGLNFYQVLALASIVEREAVLDDERSLIAGVYQNRINGIAGVTTRLLNADPTVFYAIDTIKLDDLAFDQWQRFSFWSPPGVALADVVVPEALQGFQTYQTAGLIPWPCVHAQPALDRRGARTGHDRGLHLLPRHPRRRWGARVCEDAGRAQRQPQEIRLHLVIRWPEAGDFAPPANGCPARRLGSFGPGGSRGAPRPASGSFHRRGSGRLLRGPRGAHALPDRLQAWGRRGEGGRQLGPVPRRRRRARGPGRLSLHDSGPSRSPRRPAFRGLPRPAGAMARTRGVGGRRPRGRGGGLRVAGGVAAAGRRLRPPWTSFRSRAGWKRTGR